MINTRLLLAASWLRLVSSTEGIPKLHQGLWIVPGFDEPEPIEKDESVVGYEPLLTGITFGIVRTLGQIGEWYTVLPTTEEGVVGYEPLLSGITFGIVRTLGKIGEWYTEPIIEHDRTQFPDFSYMDYVLSELI